MALRGSVICPAHTILVGKASTESQIGLTLENVFLPTILLSLDIVIISLP